MRWLSHTWSGWDVFWEVHRITWLFSQKVWENGQPTIRKEQYLYKWKWLPWERQESKLSIVLSSFCDFIFMSITFYSWSLHYGEEGRNLGLRLGIYVPIQNIVNLNLGVPWISELLPWECLRYTFFYWYLYFICFISWYFHAILLLFWDISMGFRKMKSTILRCSINQQLYLGNWGSLALKL